MRFALFTIIGVLGLVTVAPRVPAAPTKAVSGRAVGEITPSFPVLDVTGPHKGNSVCYVCESKDAPVVFAFFRQTGDEMGSLVKKLNQLAAQHQEIRVVGVVIEGQASQPWLSKFAHENGITIPLTVLRNGKDDVAMRVYKLNPSVRNTFLVSVKRKVIANLVDVNAENFNALRGAVSKVAAPK